MTILYILLFFCIFLEIRCFDMLYIAYVLFKEDNYTHERAVYLNRNVASFIFFPKYYLTWTAKKFLKIIDKNLQKDE
jgi:hypothetical protein